MAVLLLLLLLVLLDLFAVPRVLLLAVEALLERRAVLLLVLLVLEDEPLDLEDVLELLLEPLDLELVLEEERLLPLVLARFLFSINLPLTCASFAVIKMFSMNKMKIKNSYLLMSAILFLFYKK